MVNFPTDLLDPDTDVSGLCEADLVDAIGVLEEEKARASAAQARLTRRLDHLVKARHADLGVPAERRGRDVAALVAHARRESPSRAQRHVGFARTLIELPHTEAAMADGALCEWRGELIARETACLSPQHREVVDRELCRRNADGTYPFEGWGDRRLVAEAQRLVVRLDPAALVNRRSAAEADRNVSLRPAPDTMARLSALLPVAQGVAAYASLARAADAARAAGDPRSRGQVMADTLVARLTGQATADAVPVHVDLVLSDETLLANGSEPAWLDGYGPIPADAATELVASALREARAQLRRLYAAPGTGALVAMDAVSRTFPAGLALFVDLRDRTCRTPYCDAPIRHHDHVVAHADGGPTSVANGQGLCEYCNHAKQAPGWVSRPLTGPPDVDPRPHEAETTLPTGHLSRSRAPTTPRPGRLRRRAVTVEIHHPAITVEWAA